MGHLRFPLNATAKIHFPANMGPSTNYMKGNGNLIRVGDRTRSDGLADPER